jgi:hypothetical protein
LEVFWSQAAPALLAFPFLPPLSFNKISIQIWVQGMFSKKSTFQVPN